MFPGWSFWSWVKVEARLQMAVKGVGREEGECEQLLETKFGCTGVNRVWCLPMSEVCGVKEGFY